MTALVTPERIAEIRRFKLAQDGAVWCDHCDKHVLHTEVGQSDHRDDCPWPMLRDLLLALDAATASQVDAERSREHALEQWRRTSTINADLQAARDAAEADAARLLARASWAEKALTALIVESGGAVFIGGVELVGFGARMKELRAALAPPAAPEEEG